jgi:hypothetical protein
MSIIDDDSYSFVNNVEPCTELHKFVDVCPRRIWLYLSGSSSACADYQCSGPSPMYRSPSAFEVTVRPRKAGHAAMVLWSVLH